MTIPAGVVVAWREVPSGSPRREASRTLLAEMLPGATVTSRCPSCGGEHGRPRVEGGDAVVSVSYAPGWTVVAMSRTHRRIGVDAVPRDVRDLDRMLPYGSADAVGWARVEAVLKADGRGLAVDPARVEVHDEADGWRAVISSGAADVMSARSSHVRWRGWDLAAPDGVVAALVVG